MTRRCEIVIPTRDRPDQLDRCLRSLLNQTVSDFRVIVVDDCGEHPIDDVVDARRGDGLDIALLRQPAPSGPAAARNAGAAQVTTDFVLFIDDDVAADPRLVEVHLSQARVRSEGSPPIVSCGPFVEPPDWSPTPWNKWEAVQARKELDQLERGDYDVTWRQFHTGNNCLPIEEFRAVGGFDEEFKRAEDDELALRLAQRGCEFVYAPAAVALHYSYRSLQSWLAIPRAYAVHDVMLDRLHPETGHLSARRRELAERHPLLRVARWIPLHLGFARQTISMWVALARFLFRWNKVGPSMWALSAAYDLGYADSLRMATAVKGRT